MLGQHIREVCEVPQHQRFRRSALCKPLQVILDSGEPLLSLFSCCVGGAVVAHISSDERSKQPRPNRALMIRAVALQHAPTIVRSVCRT